jgi:hypothetical protein
MLALQAEIRVSDVVDAEEIQCHGMAEMLKVSCIWKF